MDELRPKDHAEAVALFRSEIVGALVRRDLLRGELAEELRKLSAQRFRPPGMQRSRTFSLPTLQRWFYQYRRGGLAALRPSPRSDRGRGRCLDPALRDLLLQIRHEHPSASAALIRRTLIKDGRLAKDTVSTSTLRRLYREHGLDRVPARDGKSPKTRLRWQAERPGALWHGDVCYGRSMLIDGQRRPIRIHALLDDASRYVPVIEARHSELESDMLALLVRAIRREGPPDALYLDNGPTYRGDVLRLACERLGITLIHARPYDAPARGKMERFWRTLREQCLDHLGSLSSLHDLNVRLWAFLDQHYHRAPHGSLFGRSPAEVWDPSRADRTADALTEDQLRDALTIRFRRRVRGDSTLSLDGDSWELDQGFLSGRVIQVARSFLDPGDPPWVEHEGKRFPLHPVDPVLNSRRKRSLRRPKAEPGPAAHFDPAGALLDRALGRKQEVSP